MVVFVRSIRFLLLLISIKLAECEQKTFNCPATDIFDSLHASASTVQSYLDRNRSTSDDQFRISDSKAQQIWMLIRHGTRTPNAEKIQELKNLGDLRDDIVDNFQNEQTIPFCKSDWEKLKQWKWNENITNDQGQMLTTRGQQELRSIAQNYKRHFSELFDSPYNSTRFKFQHTNTQRTRDSFRAFVDELFGENIHNEIESEPANVTDAFLKPYKICDAFLTQQEELKDSNSEMKKFQQSKTFKKMIKQVSKRLGFTDDKLKRKQIMNMFDMCRYEEAWVLNATSVWCTVFTPDELKILEFGKDLGSYYEFGHGSEINRHIQCSTVRDMVLHLQSDADPRVKVYFGHASTLLLQLTAMGAFKDQKKLKSKDFGNVANRKWNISKLSPFAANLVAVRYSNNQLKFFLNEELIRFDWCANGVCSIDDVKKQYEHLNYCEKTQCPNGSSSVDPIESVGSFLESLFEPLF